MTWDADQWRAYRKQKKKAGLCAWCPNRVAEKGGTLCVWCRLKTADAKKRNYDAKKAAG